MQIGLLEIKQALNDPRFRDSLPLQLRDDVVKFLNNPGCPCNVPLYKKILKECPDQLTAYFPGKELDEEKDIDPVLTNNKFMVINCKAEQLEDRLRKLPPGRKQLAIARFEDEVTVVVNEI